MSIKELNYRINKYIGSDEWKEDTIKSIESNGYNWIDVGHRVGLCSGCFSVGGGKMIELFGIMFHIENAKLLKEEDLIMSQTLINWRSTVEHIMEIERSEEYKKLKEKRRGYIRFERFNRDGGMANQNIELMYDKSLVDYLLGFDVYGKDMVEDKITAVNKIDDEIYEMGDIFCKSLPSIIYGRYFKLTWDKSREKYCFKFDYSIQFSLDDIDSRLAVLFSNRNKLYIENKEELETVLGLVL